MSPPGAALCLWHDCRGPVEDQKCQNELGVSSARPRMGGIRCNQSECHQIGWVEIAIPEFHASVIHVTTL